MSSLPAMAAASLGVMPALERNEASAPRRTSAATQSPELDIAARCSGVLCSCET